MDKNTAIADLLARGPWVYAETDDRKVVKAEVNGITFETKGGGTCDCCGQAIAVVVRFRHDRAPLSQASRNAGLVLHLGQDCAAALAKGAKDVLMQSQLRKAASDRRKRLDSARVAAARLALPGVATKLAQRPHSTLAGKTRLDEVEFLLRRGGAAGKLRAAQMIEAAQA